MWSESPELIFFNRSSVKGFTTPIGHPSFETRVNEASLHRKREGTQFFHEEIGLFWTHCWIRSDSSKWQFSVKEHKEGVAADSSEIIPYRVAHQMTLYHDHEITTTSKSADCSLKKALRATFAITNHAYGVELWLALSRRRTRFMRRGRKNTAISRQWSAWSKDSPVELGNTRPGGRSEFPFFVSYC